MLFRLIFSGKTEYCQAKSESHLLECYEMEYDDDVTLIEKVEVVTDEEAKTIMIKNTEYDENNPDDEPQFRLWDCYVGDEFELLASTDYV